MLADHALGLMPSDEDLFTARKKTFPYMMNEERQAGNMLLTLSTVYEATGDERYLRAALQIVDFCYRVADPATSPG